MMDGVQSIKCKGIPKTEQLKAKVNMEVMKGIIFGTGPSTVEACNDLRFKRDPKPSTVRSTMLRRRITCTQTSRVIGRNFRTYPHGYKEIPFPDNTSDTFAVTLDLVHKFNPNLYEEDLFEVYTEDSRW